MSQVIKYESTTVEPEQSAAEIMQLVRKYGGTRSEAGSQAPYQAFRGDRGAGAGASGKWRVAGAGGAPAAAQSKPCSQVETNSRWRENEGMADRGTYRAIKVVLLDGPDFQQLPERARHLFQTLKLTFGPTGIEVRYPGALEVELSAKTGIPLEAVPGPLDTLKERGWIDREGNVIWIVGQLEHDPHMSWDDEKHRKSIWRHLQGLPRLEIVGEFVRHYQQWFEAGESVTAKNSPKPLDPAPVDLLHWLDAPPSKAHGRPMEGPSKALRRPYEGVDQAPGTPFEGVDQAPGTPFEVPSTEYRIPNTEEREPKRAPAREDSPAGGGLPSGSDPPGSVGGLDPPPPGRRMSASQVLEAWASAQPIEVPAADRRKQKPFARRIADGHTWEQVMVAFVGIGQLFPHCPPKNQPWDLSDLDRKFSKAVAAARDHPEIQARRFEEEFMAMTGPKREGTA